MSKFKLMDNLTESAKRKYIIINTSEEIGISKTAKLFKLSRTTVHNWIKRFKESGFEGLQNKSRKNQYFKNKMPDKVLENIFKLKAINPKISAKKIKETLNLNYSLSTIYFKLSKFDQFISNTKSYKQVRHDKNKIYFKDFFVSIRKIINVNYHRNKIPKYIILLEEKSTGIVFSSFSFERISISIAIFLEYFVESLRRAKLGSDYNFYLSGAIKLSKNDMIIQILNDKYQFKVITNAIASKFHSNSQKQNPYKILSNNLLSRSDDIHQEDELLAQTQAFFLKFNFRQLKNFHKKNSHISNAVINTIQTSFLNYFPIITDNYISQINEILNKYYFFENMFSIFSTNKFNIIFKHANRMIEILWDESEKIKNQYKFKLSKEPYLIIQNIFQSEEPYLLIQIISEHFITIISKLLSNQNELNRTDKNNYLKILNNIVSILIKSLTELSNIAGDNGLLEKRIKLIKETIFLKDKFDFNAIEIKNNLAVIYVFSNYGSKAYKLLNDILADTQTDKKQFFTAKITLASYYKVHNRLRKAISTYKNVIGEIGDQYPELKIQALLQFNMIYLFTNNSLDIYPHKSLDIRSYLQDAIDCSKKMNTSKFDIQINQHLGVNYAINGEFEESEKYLKKTITASINEGHVIFQYRTFIKLGEVYLIQGKYNKALTSIKSILNFVQNVNDYTSEISAYQSLSELYLDLKKYKISEEYADKAIFISKFLNYNERFILSMICKINIYIEQLKINNIINTFQLLKKYISKTEYPTTKFTLDIISHKVEFLKTIYSLLDTNVSTSNKEKHIIDILDQVNSKINKTSKKYKIKAELSFLYCKLFKYLFDFAEKNGYSIKHMISQIKDQYLYNLKITKELYSTLSIEFPRIQYINRLEEIKNFPNS
ncbi:MAG: helix-turn-helix domain-containing protein [Candidatus Delongbacteria bacterium]|nr:helix-turn-helix domain-containing protein [Candidatus Delongbacteria bacterium]